MDRFKVLPISVFVGHGHLQHVGARWEGSTRLCYHAYFILAYMSLKAAISFAYGASFFIRLSATYSTDGYEDDVIAPSDIRL